MANLGAMNLDYKEYMMDDFAYSLWFWVPVFVTAWGWSE